MRQFIASSMPDSGGNLTVTGKDFKYLHQVLRLKPGDAIHVRLPSGQLQTMAVTEISGRSLCLSCRREGENRETGVTALEVEQSADKNRVPLWLFQFVTKPQKMDLIIRQAAELGVTRIVPVLGRHCQKEAVRQREDRWERIIREARQQSGSPIQTEVVAPHSPTEAVELWRAERGNKSCGVVLYERSGGTRSFHQAVADMAAAGNGGNSAEPTTSPLETATAPQNFTAAALVSGCEGGIAPDELQILVESGFVPVHLDTNILRAETASLYGLAVLQNLLTERHIWRSRESSC